MPSGARDRQGSLRQGAPQGSQPRRGRGRRCGDPRGRPDRRGQRPPPARRHPARSAWRPKEASSPSSSSRNTTIPTEKKETFTTADDNQTAVTIKVYQGERRWPPTTGCSVSSTSKGSPAPAWGTPQIEVDFNLDANGILQVSAKDKGTGKEQSIKVESLRRPDQGRDRPDAARRHRPRRRGQAQRDLAEARNKRRATCLSVGKATGGEQRQTLGIRHDRSPSAIDKVNQVKTGEDTAAIQQGARRLATRQPGHVRTPVRRIGHSRSRSRSGFLIQRRLAWPGAKVG